MTMKLLRTLYGTTDTDGGAFQLRLETTEGNVDLAVPASAITELINVAAMGARELAKIQPNDATFAPATAAKVAHFQVDALGTQAATQSHVILAAQAGHAQLALHMDRALLLAALEQLDQSVETLNQAQQRLQ